jgi:hypothetical protein
VTPPRAAQESTQARGVGEARAGSVPRTLGMRSSEVLLTAPWRPGLFL